MATAATWDQIISDPTYWSDPNKLSTIRLPKGQTYQQTPAIGEGPTQTVFGMPDDYWSLSNGGSNYEIKYDQLTGNPTGFWRKVGDKTVANYGIGEGGQLQFTGNSQMDTNENIFDDPIAMGMAAAVGGIGLAGGLAGAGAATTAAPAATGYTAAAPFSWDALGALGTTVAPTVDFASIGLPTLGEISTAAGIGTTAAEGASILKTVASVFPTLSTAKDVVGLGATLYGLYKASQGSPDAPQINFEDWIKTQQNVNEDTLTANRYDEVTPTGSRTWTKDANGKWTSTTALSPGQQQIFDKNQSTQLNMANLANTGLTNLANQGQIGTPLDFSSAAPIQSLSREGLPGIRSLTTKDLPAIQQDSMAFRDRIAKEYYDQTMRILGPEMEKVRTQTDLALRNQGLFPGSEAYNDKMKTVLDSQGIQLKNLSSQAQILAGQEMSRLMNEQRLNRGTLFGERKDLSNFDMDLRNMLWGENKDLFNASMGERKQDIAEILTQRTVPQNEVMALLSGSQVNVPNFGAGAAMNSTDALAALQAAYGSTMGGYNADVTANNALIQALLGLAGNWAASTPT